MTVGGFQRNWFIHSAITLANGSKLPMATLKDEYKDEFAAHTKDLLEQLTQREPSAGLDALTDEQLKELSGKYDTDDMSYDEYQSFLTDLVDMGALTETDRRLAGGARKEGDQYLALVLPAASFSIRDASLDAITASPSSYDFPLGMDSVNVTEWIKYRASYDTTFFGAAGKCYDIGTDEVNQTVADILRAMSRIS